MSKRIWHTVFLGVGSNLQDREENIKKAIYLLKKTQRIKVKKVSRIYQTNPVGGLPQRRFLNGAIKIETTLSPLKLLKRLKEIEKTLGRRKIVRFGPRIIDLDILLYENKKIRRKNLVIPHPKMYKRSFVMKPLREIL